MRRNSDGIAGFAILLFVIGFGIPFQLTMYMADVHLGGPEISGAFVFSLLLIAYFYRKFKQKSSRLDFFEQADSALALSGITFILGLILGLFSTLITILPIYWWIKWPIVGALSLVLLIHELDASSKNK